MLSKPEFGWSVITIGDLSHRCSYIDDVPFMLLEALETSCRENKPTVVKLDAEGWWHIIVFDDFWTYIITEMDESYLSVGEIDRVFLAKELITDIRRDIDDWARWSCEDMTEDQISERKEDLLVLCNAIEKML